MRVGFVGVGVMGAAMAQNVLKAGHEVLVYDTSRDAITAMVRAGAQAAPSGKYLAAACDVVITMLPTPADVEAAVLGPDGILEGAVSGLIYIDMSTGEPMLAQRLARMLGERGIVAIDCPVGRTHSHAVAGTLLLMAGGDRTAVERLRPLLMCMGNELVYCGGAGMGQAI
jgi:4-hydroxybutyrate dehydrogenase/sulfolactaldehyde 3-reductase